MFHFGRYNGSDLTRRGGIRGHDSGPLGPLLRWTAMQSSLVRPVQVGTTLASKYWRLCNLMFRACLSRFDWTAWIDLSFREGCGSRRRARGCLFPPCFCHDCPLYRPEGDWRDRIVGWMREGRPRFRRGSLRGVDSARPLSPVSFARDRCSPSSRWPNGTIGFSRFHSSGAACSRP